MDESVKMIVGLFVWFYLWMHLTHKAGDWFEHYMEKKFPQTKIEDFVNGVY